jgi:hypothetical protein
MASAARQGLDLLLQTYPDFDLLEVELGWMEPDLARPWLIVVLGQPSADGSPAWVRHSFAIWKSTGAVHGLQHDGSVTDDALFGP